MTSESSFPPKSVSGTERAETEMNRHYALLSVSDKQGIADFAKSLASLGYALIATGGTGKELSASKLSYAPIEEFTGKPESFDGRVKTISFEVGAGILFDRTNPSHVSQAHKLGVKTISIVVCNLYPTKKAEDPEIPLEDLTETIDVGGAILIRSAAKNFQNVLAIVDPQDYNLVSEMLEENKANLDFRLRLAAKAFSYLSLYDTQVARLLRSRINYDNIKYN